MRKKARLVLRATVTAFILFALVPCVATEAGGVPGTVKSHQKISDTEGNFTGTLSSMWFGGSVTAIGDFDGDGVTDLAVGAPHYGGIWILFMNANGTVKSHQYIDSVCEWVDDEGWECDWIGGDSVAPLGDLDGDGVSDLAVGYDGDGDGGSQRGAVFILFMNTNGTVKSHQKISDTQGNFTGMLADYDHFGRSVASIGDLDGDGVMDLAVGAYGDGGTNYIGALWILFMNTNGTVKSHQKINGTEGGFTGTLHNWDYFGRSVATIDDLNADGVMDLAVGAPGDDDGGSEHGAVWVLFMNTNGTVKSHQKISDTQGNFTGTLNYLDWLGSSVASIGDLDGDGVTDLAVGAEYDNDGGTDRGAMWILFMNTNGTVKSHQKISDTQGNFTGTLDNEDVFGSSVASIGDLDGDGVTDLAVGARWDDDGGTDHGAVWILFMNGNVSYKKAMPWLMLLLGED